MDKPNSPESNSHASRQIIIGRLTIDMLARCIWLNGHRIRLAPLEFGLLLYLARHVGQLIPYDEILREVWRCCPQTGGTLNQLKSCVKRLRQKIEPDPKRHRYVLSVRGHGYMMPVQANDSSESAES